MRTTWSKSRIGKFILGFVLFLNVFTTVFFVPIQAQNLSRLPVSEHKEFVLQTIFKTAVDYLSISSDMPILPSVHVIVSFSFNIGFLIIALLGIAGSGFFADDKQGKVIEIYLSRMTRSDYTIGKILGMFLYCNLFITLPYLILSLWMVQGLGQNQFEFLGVYVGLIMVGALISLLFTIFTLILSSLVEKRSYASLAFFIGFILIDSLSRGFYESDSNNEFLLLIVPSYLLGLLIYTLGGDWNLGLREGGVFNNGPIKELLLNDGIGIEWFHILGFVLIIFILGIGFLLFKIHRMTTENL
jgi:hypothetical protein